MVERIVLFQVSRVDTDSPEQLVAAAIRRYFDSLGVQTSGVVLLAIIAGGLELRYFGDQDRDSVDIENAVLWAADVIRETRT